MSDSNLICEMNDCPHLAKLFGLKGSLKIRSCDNHISSLIKDVRQIYPISGYSFINSVPDGPLFEERWIQVEKGRENLAAIEANCESELAAALKGIESLKGRVMKTVESHFDEIKVTVIAACSAAREQLSRLSNEYEAFLFSKENQLSRTAKSVCATMSVTPMLVRYGIADVSELISAVLSDSWTVAPVDVHSTLSCLDATQKKAAVESALEEGARNARKGVMDALRYVELLTDSDASFDQAKNQVVAELLKLEKEKIEQSMKWLQCSWDLRQQYGVSDSATLAVGHQLARLLYRQYGKFAKAEVVLRRCSEIANTLNPLSEESILLHNELCGISLSKASYPEAEKRGVQVLETFGTEDLPAEHYWTTLLYLTYTLQLQAKHNEANALLEDWKKRDLGEESSLAELLRSLTCGVGAYYNESKKDAESCLLQAKRIATSFFPTSLYSALALYFLAVLSAGDLREKYHREAQSVFEVAAPMSIHAAVNLKCLSAYYSSTKKLRDAVECCSQAQSIYEVAAHDSIDTAANLSFLGDLLREASQYTEATECYIQEQFIREGATPSSTEAAVKLSSLGNVHKAKEEWNRAEMLYRKAESILEITSPRSVEAAENSLYMGE